MSLIPALLFLFYVKSALWVSGTGNLMDGTLIPKKIVFISYAHKDYLDDNNIIIQDSAIADIVDTFKANSIEYLIDVEKMECDDYMDRIQQWIQKADFFLFVSSEKSNSEESYWPIREVKYATEINKKIVVIKIDNAEFKTKLALSGLDYIEYYKNRENALHKLISTINADCNKETVVKPPVRKLFKTFVKDIGIIFSVIFLSFSIGAISGWFERRVNTEDLFHSANLQGHFTIKGENMIHYDNVGRSISFDYDVNSKRIVMDSNASGLKLFDLKEAWKGAAPVAFIPKAIKEITSNNRNAKATAIITIVVVVGYFTGYLPGNYFGKDYAQMKNKVEIEEFLIKNDSIIAIYLE